MDGRFVVALSELSNRDVPRVGGKNASLGEMIARLAESGIRVPEGFATTVDTYWSFIEHNAIGERMGEAIGRFRDGDAALGETGEAVRGLFLGGEFPPAAAEAIREAYRELALQLGRDTPEVAVRSSATAEDLPEASFAGQQETFLNVRGEQALMAACRRCFASLFTNRAIAYRENQGIDHLRVALSVGVQRMVRADLAGAGVMFSIDTETGFPETVLINANWGLGETVVQGTIDPDEYAIYKRLLVRDCVPIINRKRGGKQHKMIYADAPDAPTQVVDCTPEEMRRPVLEEEEILQLARWAVAIERHYGKPMDMEWAKDGRTGELFIVQARPETVQARRRPGTLMTFRLRHRGEKLLEGAAVGSAIAVGRVRRMEDPKQGDDFHEGDILVTEMTDPDWVPVMKRAAAIITDHGGRTSHAAIVSRELALPAVVGTGHATRMLEDGRTVTVSCAEGDVGFVYDGAAEFEAEEMEVTLPGTRTAVMLNLANPAAASRWWRLPADGVGLARMEFIIGNQLKVHPMALAHFDRVADAEARRAIEALTAGWEDKAEFFVENLAYGIARIAAVFYPDPVIVRLSDFKTNEYARLIGGAAFEPAEENPMLGWRGASRYYSAGYRDGFALECRALKRVRERIGLDNVVIMVPFCRTPEEADRVLEEMARHGLQRGKNGLAVYVMSELPSNILLADRFAERFDGFSIGSNDLTQLTLGVDRDSERLTHLFDERNEAVLNLIAEAIARGRANGRTVGLCGQAPSDHPEVADFLVRHGIDSISVDPGSFVRVKQRVHAVENGG